MLTKPNECEFPITIPIHDIAWLAGILEGEASFGYGCTPILEIGMTDEDVINKISTIIKKKYFVTFPKQKMKDGSARKTVYRIRLFGVKAIQIMQWVFPFMGKRRKEKIIEVLNLFYNQKKINYDSTI